MDRHGTAMSLGKCPKPLAVAGEEIACGVGGAIIHNDHFTNWFGLVQDTIEGFL